MNKKRLVGVLLFSIAGLIVWFCFIAITNFLDLQESLLGGISVLISVIMGSYFISPKIYGLHKAHIRLKSFGFGVLVTLISYLAGSFIFTFILALFDSLDLGSFFFIALFCFGISSIYMSPGFILGGLTGVLFHYLSNKFEPETE